MWSIDSSDVSQRQHLLEIILNNLLSRAGVLYHLVSILNPHSCVATFRDPL